MGSQQILLIILATVIVGIAVIVGISLFSDNAVSANRDAVASDLSGLAGRAQQYYRRPTTMNGGGSSFMGLTADAAGLQKLTSLPGGKNENGTFSITAAGTASEVVIEGIGRESAADGNPVTVDIHVRDANRPDSLVWVH
jgi:hypothetical protein